MNIANVLPIDNKRVYGLDILRALAVFFVVLGHGGRLLNENIAAIHKYFIFDGVAIFFVLSGFLIGGILIKTYEKQVSFRVLISFWRKRWLRTLPAYYFTFLLLIILNVKEFDKITVWPILKYAIFVQNVSSPHPNFFPEAWSLSVEEWFYLTIPILLVCLIRLVRCSVKQAVIVLVVVIIAETIAFRYFRFVHLSPSIVSWNDMFRKQVITQLDSIMFGVFGAYWAYYYKASWVKIKRNSFIAGIWILFVQHLLTVMGLFGSGMYQCVFSFSCTSVGVLLLLPYCSELKMGSGIVYKTVSTVAIISYSMYLLNHSVIEDGILRKVDFNCLAKHHMASFVVYPLYWFLTILFSLIMYRCIEKPFMDMRKRLDG